jgi:hypothetical protein
VPFVGRSKATSGELLSGNNNSSTHYPIYNNNDHDYNDYNSVDNSVDDSVDDFVYDSVDAKVYNNSNNNHF